MAGRSMYHGFQTYGPDRFNFKDMSMHQHQKPARPDYFTLKPLRGSSPTSSLTADLDANFHIDKRYRSASHSSRCPLSIACSPIVRSSPQAPTPRRSLFTANLFRPRDNAGECKRKLQWLRSPACPNPADRASKDD